MLELECSVPLTCNAEDLPVQRQRPIALRAFQEAVSSSINRTCMTVCLPDYLQIEQLTTVVSRHCQRGIRACFTCLRMICFSCWHMEGKEMACGLPPRVAGCWLSRPTHPTASVLLKHTLPRHRCTCVQD